jgi:hypothetical protein
MQEEANSQFDADCDALARLHNALVPLKRFLQDLMRKVPDVIEVVHSKREHDGLDPFEENDMRQCLENLLLRYRKDEELGILTTVIQSMKEQQGSKNLSTHIQNVEDWRQDMRRLGVESVSIDDLAAFIAISGMQAIHRTEFMEQENIFTMALQQLDVHDSDDELTTSSRRKKPLFAKVRDYAKKYDDTRLINLKLRSKEASNPASESTRELKQTMIEAQQAFYVAMKKSYADNPGHTKSNRDNRICFGFARNGTCVRGTRAPLYMNNQPTTWEGPTILKGTCTAVPTGQAATTVAANAVTNPPQSAPSQKGNDKKKTVMFNIQTDDWDEDDDRPADKQFAGCVIVESKEVAAAAKRGAKSTHQAHSVTSHTRGHYLGWDTIYGISLDIIPGAKAIRSDRKADRLGGTRSITHQGISSLFGIEMAYINGGNTPNLLSVGTALQADDNGQTGVTIFTNKGAIRMHKNTEIEEMVSALVDRATELELVEGYATIKNNVIAYIANAIEFLNTYRECLSTEKTSHNMRCHSIKIVGGKVRSFFVYTARNQS